MVEALKLELVSPEKLILSENVEMAVLPGGEGDFGVMRGHSPVISTLRPGEIVVFEKNKVKSRIFVGGGFVEVNDQVCTILAEDVENVDDIDRDEALKMLGVVEEEMRATENQLVRNSATRKRDSLVAKLSAIDNPAYS
ncbi:MAG: ATP synthase F1 subunit epsilon [Pseudomonadota bacterium]|nr:ATP synthase F1 subunit epsilon [Pseudomonadota bacterium]